MDQSGDGDALWQRLQLHFGERPQFVRRLAGKLGWAPTFALAGLREYQRYCWLAVRAGHTVRPSEIVDQVWHQHLLHTRDYWAVFCPQVLGCALHHEPGDPGAEARWRWREQYAQTLASYQRHFGAPPEAFWPAPGAGVFYRLVECRRRVAGTARKRGTAMRLLAVPALLPLAASAAIPLGPLDWSGPSFLALFALLATLAVMAAQTLRRRLRAAPGLVLDAAPLDLAYLAGGEERWLDAALAQLMAQDIVRWDARSGLSLADDPATLGPPLRAVAEAVRRQPKSDRLRRTLEPTFRTVRAALEQRQLLLGAAATWRLRLLSAAIPLALIVFGAAKIGIGIARDRPVGLLAAACVLLAGYALALLLRSPPTTRLGDAVLARARRRHVAAQRAPRTQDLGLAVALLGTGALAGTAYAAYHQRKPADPADNGTGSDSSSSSDSSGSGDGGSGCGGCGGGD